MLPFRDENPAEIRPYVTVLFIGLNIAAWLVLQGAGEPQALRGSVIVFGAVPCQITGECTAPGLGWSAIFTSMFMHGSWGHLIGNMLFLWVFGNNIEDSMGHIRFIIFYLLCGLAATFTHIFIVPDSALPMVGASGAISGVMGAYVVLYPRVRIHTWVPPFFVLNLSAVFVLVYWFVLQLLMGLSELGPQTSTQGGVAVWAHIGGFLAGVILIKVFEKPTLTNAKRRGIKLGREEVKRLEW